MVKNQTGSDATADAVFSLFYKEAQRKHSHSKNPADNEIPDEMEALFEKYIDVTQAGNLPTGGNTKLSGFAPVISSIVNFFYPETLNERLTNLNWLQKAIPEEFFNSRPDFKIIKDAGGGNKRTLTKSISIIHHSQTDTMVLADITTGEPVPLVFNIAKFNNGKPVQKEYLLTIDPNDIKTNGIDNTKFKPYKLETTF